MADLSITMHGDASGAADALKHVGHEAGALHEVLTGALKGALGSTVATFSSLETVAEKAAEVVKDFFKESIEDYAKAERATNQLRAAAGSLTGAFQEQAEAMGVALNVKAQDIEHMQMLLLRYGAAPNEIEKTTKAVLDYAAATGQDANSALMMMIRGVENGHGSLGRMGVQFKATGDFAKDLGAAADALGEKFGGAAETDANGLSGRMRGAALAMERVRESFGRMFDVIETRLHLLTSLKSALDNIAKGVDEGGLGGLFTAMGLHRSADDTSFKPNGAASDVHLGKPGSVAFGEEGLPETPLYDTTEKARKGGGGGGLGRDFKREMEMVKAQKLEDDRDEEDKLKEHDARLEEEEDRHYDASRKRIEEGMKDQVDQTALALKQADESSQKLQESFTKESDEIGKMQLDVLKHQTDAMRGELERREREWTSAGVRIGQSVIDGIFSVILAAQNGQSDKGMAGAKAAQGLMKAIFGAFGMSWAFDAGMGGANAFGAGEGGDAGAAFGAFAGGTAGNIRFSAPESHGGGYVQVFHRGGYAMRADEQLALLQTGERVLSRREVTGMGGPSGVEAAVQGGGNRSLTIQAFDSSSILDFFGDRGGRGMLNAARANVGPLRLMFGSR